MPLIWRHMKRNVEDLALFGGTPAFAAELHVGRPNIGNRAAFLERVTDILDRRYLTNGGPYEVAFELQLADMLGVRNCVATANATLALEIAARAAGLSGEVIVPSFTFVATAHALAWQGITPVFCDVLPGSYTLDPANVVQLISPRTSGIIAVHLWGRPASVDELTEIARRHGLALLFDAAHALGCSYKGRMVGSFGLAEIFSFHATKFVNAFEGGAIATNDDEIAARARLMRNFGFVGVDAVGDIGTNAKMSEVSAAMGITSLESIGEFVAINRSHYASYQRHLAGVAGITLLTYDDSNRTNYQYVVLEVNPKRVGLSRDQLMTLLQAENVLVRRYFYPGCHRLPPYRSALHGATSRLMVTEHIADRVLVLPTGTGVTEDEVMGVAELIRFVASHADAIRSRLGT